MPNGKGQHYERITDAVIDFLNDRKGFHVSDLDAEVKLEFTSDLRACIRDALFDDPR